MPEFQHPGVYIDEIERGPRPIEGVPTTSAAFLGETERGSLTPRMVTSYASYQRWFGGVFDANKYLPHTLSGFFENGGQIAYVCRVVGKGAATAKAAFGDFTVRAAGRGLWGTRVKVKISDGTKRNADGNSVGFRVQVAYWDQGSVPRFDPFTDASSLPRPSSIEDFDDLEIDEASPSFYGKCASVLITLVRGSFGDAGLRPANGIKVLDGGKDAVAPVSAADYEAALAALESPAREIPGLHAVSLVYAPNASIDIAKAVVAHCEKMRYRFAVIDCEQGQSDAAQLNPGDAIVNSSYGAFYYPWIVAPEPGSGTPRLTPPGGHVLGIYARSDMEKGVFKAPANEVVRGAIDLEFHIDAAVQDVLNPRGVNVIRSFPGRGIRVWGARTMASDALWKYINVRRLFIFLERSIYEGTQWAVFEANDERLWGRVSTLITLFLRAQWRAGALMGRTDREAYFVKCDRTTMTQDDILSGRLICEVGVAPVRAAEFVIFRIFQRAMSS